MHEMDPVDYNELNNIGTKWITSYVNSQIYKKILFIVSIELISIYWQVAHIYVDLLDNGGYEVLHYIDVVCLCVSHQVISPLACLTVWQLFVWHWPGLSSDLVSINDIQHKWWYMKQ